jgi:hypothetical protein
MASKILIQFFFLCRSSSVGDIQWMRLEETDPTWDREETLLD